MKMSFREYLDSTKKEYPQIYFNYFYRKLSHPISYIFLNLGITPNQVSVSSIFLALVGGTSIFYGNQ